jgi:MoaA/NifB/PqqE/SkfB family radical SAM enzyme
MYANKPLLHKRQEISVPGTLRTVTLDVTSKCNMTCSKCYAETFVGREPLGFEHLAKALQEFYELGVFHYVLQGGEAITDPARLEFILRNCHPDESYINVISNGWGMTRKKIQWLKALKVDKIAFSLDSGIEKEHDQDRLQGSYKWVCSAIDTVISEGLLTSISIVVTHESLHSDGFNRALDFIKSKGIRMDVQIAEPVGKWDGKKDMLITPEDAAYIKQLQHECGRLPNGQMVINRDIFSGSCDHCPAATEFMSLSVDGELLPCNFLQYSLGNVREYKIKDMRDAILKSDWFDGNQPVCICGEDFNFIDQFISPYVGKPKPLDAYAVFDLIKPCAGPQRE